MIAIIDYGMGNLRSVQKAFEFIGETAEITSDAKKIAMAEKIVLPGVGAFRDAISTIRGKGLDKEILKAVKDGKPFLGICLGMQLIFDKSFEDGEFEGLKILSGEIVKFNTKEKVPHIGWNSLDIKKKSPLFSGLPEKPYVYFVHSYYLETKADVVSATTFYDGDKAAAAESGNVFALQFHPEKSGDTGLQILRNFGRI